MLFLLVARRASRHLILHGGGPFRLLGLGEPFQRGIQRPVLLSRRGFDAHAMGLDVDRLPASRPLFRQRVVRRNLFRQRGAGWDGRVRLGFVVFLQGLWQP